MTARRRETEQLRHSCLTAIEQVMNITPEQLRGASRVRARFYARVIYAHFCITETFRTTREVAADLKRTRQMTTYYVDTYKRDYDRYTTFRALADAVRKRIAEIEREAFEEAKEHKK